MEKPKSIILIGGAEGTGKSTLAKQLAEHLEIPWFSTDQIRTILYTVIDEEEHKIDVEKRMIKIWAGVLALVNRPFPWENGGIIEGTGILPELVARDLKENPVIRPVFLFQENNEKVVAIVSERSKLPWIKTKTDEAQKQKVETLKEFNRKIMQDAKRFGFPIVTAHREGTFGEVLKIVKK